MSLWNSTCFTSKNRTEIQMQIIPSLPFFSALELNELNDGETNNRTLKWSTRLHLSDCGISRVSLQLGCTRILIALLVRCGNADGCVGKFGSVMTMFSIPEIEPRCHVNGSGICLLRYKRDLWSRYIYVPIETSTTTVHFPESIVIFFDWGSSIRGRGDFESNWKLNVKSHDPGKISRGILAYTLNSNWFAFIMLQIW